MIIPYTEIDLGLARPLLDVSVGPDALEIKALVDSGAVHTLLPAWLEFELDPIDR